MPVTMANIVFFHIQVLMSRDTILIFSYHIANDM